MIVVVTDVLFVVAVVPAKEEEQMAGIVVEKQRTRVPLVVVD